MKSFLRRLYISTFISSFGNWLTFLAIALLVKEHYGGQHVAWVFLAQTLPTLIFSRTLTKLIPTEHQSLFYFWCHIILAFNSLLLCFFNSLPFIYAHLFLGALVKSISNPLLNTLIPKWSEGHNTEEVYTRVGSLQVATLALAPALGAWLKLATSANFLFLVDSISFLVSILLIRDRLIEKSLFKKIDFSLTEVSAKEIFSNIVKVPKGVPLQLWIYLSSWFSFLTLGALLNALEFARFEQLKLSEPQIGQVMAAWGIGSLVAFISKRRLPILLSGGMFLLSILSFLSVAPIHIVILSFAVGGCSSSLFSGALRARIQQSVPKDYDALPVWSFVNQCTQGINLAAYVGVGLLLSRLGYLAFACFALIVGAFSLLAIAAPKFFEKQEVQI